MLQVNWQLADPAENAAPDRFEQQRLRRCDNRRLLSYLLVPKGFTLTPPTQIILSRAAFRFLPFGASRTRRTQMYLPHCYYRQSEPLFRSLSTELRSTRSSGAMSTLA